MDINDLQISRALTYYRENREKINLRRRLPGLFRTAVRRNETRRRAELAGLVQAARRILLRRSPVQAKLAKTLRRRFEKAIGIKRGVDVSRVALEMCGTSLDGLRDHLEMQFKPGMAWHNYGFDGWHIDHKRPLVSFDLSDPEQQRLAFHYTNLQPLWKADNFAKGRKIIC